MGCTVGRRPAFVGPNSVRLNVGRAALGLGPTLLGPIMGRILFGPAFAPGPTPLGPTTGRTTFGLSSFYISCSAPPRAQHHPVAQGATPPHLRRGAIKNSPPELGGEARSRRGGFQRAGHAACKCRNSMGRTAFGPMWGQAALGPGRILFGPRFALGPTPLDPTTGPTVLGRTRGRRLFGPTHGRTLFGFTTKRTPFAPRINRPSAVRSAARSVRTPAWIFKRGLEDIIGGGWVNGGIGTRG